MKLSVRVRLSPVFIFARLVELVDTSDLKSDSILEYRFKSGNEYFHQNDGIGRHARFRF